MYRRARCTLSMAFYGRAKLGTKCIQTKRKSHGVYERCTVLYRLPYLPSIRCTRSIIPSLEIVTCHTPEQLARAALPTQTKDRRCQLRPCSESQIFFPTSGGGYSHLTHSPRSSSVLQQLEPPNSGYRTLPCDKLSTSRVSDSALIQHHHHYRRRGDRRKRSSREMGLSW